MTVPGRSTLTNPYSFFSPPSSSRNNNMIRRFIRIYDDTCVVVTMILLPRPQPTQAPVEGRLTRVSSPEKVTAYNMHYIHLLDYNLRRKSSVGLQNAGKHLPHLTKHLGLVFAVLQDYLLTGLDLRVRLRNIYSRIALLRTREELRLKNSRQNGRL